MAGQNQPAAGNDVSLPLAQMVRQPNGNQTNSDASGLSGALDDDEQPEPAVNQQVTTQVSTTAAATANTQTAPFAPLPFPAPPNNPFRLLESFEGINAGQAQATSGDTRNLAVDASGAVGPNHYMQTVNDSFAIYDKQGNPIDLSTVHGVGSPTPTPSSSPVYVAPTSTFWNGFSIPNPFRRRGSVNPCRGAVTDAVVLYDHAANQWVVSRLGGVFNPASPSFFNYYQCFAISQTSDPTGVYYRYAFLINAANDFNDYPKIGIWPDAYYMTARRRSPLPPTSPGVTSPPAPTLTAAPATPAPTLGTNTYFVRTTCTYPAPGGTSTESPLGPESSLVVADPDVLVVNSPNNTQCPGATSWSIYAATQSGAELLQAPNVTIDPHHCNSGFVNLPIGTAWVEQNTGLSIRSKDIGTYAVAFQRSQMLLGLPAQMTSVFTLLNTVDANGNYECAQMLPADWDGQMPPPANAPNYMIRTRSTQQGYTGGKDTLQIYYFHVDWSPLGIPTLGDPQGNPNVSLFPNSYSPAPCVHQPGTTAGTASCLDPLTQGTLMYRLAYRNLGNNFFESLLLNQAVQATVLDANGNAVQVATPRWYELRNATGFYPWFIFEQGDLASDTSSRWVASIAADQLDDIAMGYNISSETLFPSIAFAGRSGSDPSSPGQLSLDTMIVKGNGVQSGYGFWGDYSQLTVDPSDDCTLWYVNGYQPTNSPLPVPKLPPPIFAVWGTHIASFRSPTCPRPKTLVSFTPIVLRYGNPIAAAAGLLNSFNGMPIHGMQVGFDLGDFSCTGVTDFAGQASCNFRVTLPPGSYPITVSFAGTEQYLASSANATLVVAPQTSTLTYTGPVSTAIGASLQVSAVLQDGNAAPVVGRPVRFMLGSGPAAQSCIGTTNTSGVASCIISPVIQSAGSAVLALLFAGDAFYNPASASVAVATEALWQSGVSYQTGNEAVYNGLLYIARQAHTSQTGWEPPNVYALWARVEADTNGFWAVQVLYHVGDIASYQGHSYQVIQAHQSETGWEPPNAPFLWQFIN
ncbi:MAG TPA: carbohydrate-binding protein [Terriglobales bacterium]|nr:carbohydrate-binding protein [Terriglobales bacterium]